MCISSHIQAKSPTQRLWYVWIAYHRRCLWNNRCQIEQSDELPLDLLRGLSMVVEPKGVVSRHINNWSTSCPTCRWMCLCVAVQIPLVSMTIGPTRTPVHKHSRTPLVSRKPCARACLWIFYSGETGVSVTVSGLQKERMQERCKSTSTWLNVQSFNQIYFTNLINSANSVRVW